MEIEAAKAEVVVASPVSGLLTRILASVGDVLLVHDGLAVFAIGE